MTEDQDPTGMRHLLAGLKETGPMPDDLSDRIRASLADEEAARSGDAPDEGATDGAGFWQDGDDDGVVPLRRRPMPWILGAAAGTVVALGVGGLMLSGNAGQDAANSGAPEQHNAQTSGSTGSDGATGAPTPSADDEVPAFAITASGTDYTRDTVADGAAKLLDNPTEFPTNEDDQALGTMTTAAGATDCLGRLGQPQMQAVVIDVAKFDGRSGLLLIADSPPDGGAKAWAITSGCEPIWPDPIDVATK